MILRFALALVFSAIIPCVFAADIAAHKGSAQFLDGKIVCVSIFADDESSSWGKARVSPYAKKTVDYMKIATKWISKKARKFERKPEFVHDFFGNGGIFYRTKFDCDMTDNAIASKFVWRYIERAVDLGWIRKTYGTDNIFFVVFLNTGKKNRVHSRAQCYCGKSAYPYEIVYINRYVDGIETSPAAYAHEILHVFGAEDLYCADSLNNFPSEFVAYCAETYPNDIMFTINDKFRGSIYDKITNDFSDIDAYYVGFLSECAEVTRFSLHPSEHLPQN